MGFLHTTTVQKSKNDGWGPSNSIFHDLPQEVVLGDHSKGIYLGGRFFAFDGSVASNVGRYNGNGVAYRSYEDTGGSIAQASDEWRGASNLTTSTTNNHETWLQAGGATGVHALLSDADGSRFKSMFEARVDFSSVGDNIFGAFIGLGEEGSAAADTLTDAGALADKDLLGFFRAEGDGDNLDIVYRKAGGSVVTVASDILDGSAQEYGTLPSALVADTAIKLGWRYEPDNTDGAVIKFYVNGIELPDTVDASTFASTFPDGEEMSFLAGLKNATGAAGTLAVHRWDYAQIAC